MKKRYSEEQLIGFLREGEDGMLVKELCHRYGLSEVSYYLWRSKFGRISVPDARLLKDYEAENARFRPMHVRLALESLRMHVARIPRGP